MWQAIQQADRYWFQKINTDWTNSFLDSVFPWWRNQNTWLPLYLFLLLFVFMNFGWRIWKWVVTVALTVTLTDQFSSHLIKLWIQKPRPCQDPLMMDHVRLLIGCPGNPGFTSSHATNHFGAACLFYFTLKPVLKNWSNWWFFWAATVSYAQIYVGIHYPLDVVGGTVFGSIIGSGMAALYNHYVGLPPLLQKPFGLSE